MSDAPPQQKTAPTTSDGATETVPKALLWRAAGILSLLVALAVAGYLWMQNDSLATLVELSGRPERDTATTLLKWEKAAISDDFNAGDGARTSKNATAHFRLRGGARLGLRPASLIRFKKRGPKGALNVDVEMGAADILSGTTSLTINSEFGEIVLDAGSAITLTREGDNLNIHVELGQIQLNNRAIGVGGNVELELGGIIVDVPLPEEPKPEASVAPEPTPAPLNVGNGVPSADLVAQAGDTFVVHDPNPPTAVGLNFAGVCEGPAQVKSGNQVAEATKQANLHFARGKHKYEVRCLNQPEAVAAAGVIHILQDAGTRKLPRFTPTANITTDGRRYTVLYQHRLPQVTVNWPTAPEAQSYTLTLDGRAIQTKTPHYTLSSLRRGKHSVHFSAPTTPPRQSRTTTIDVAYDTQAPAARVSDPPLGFAATDSVPLSGRALPGWQVSVGGRQLELDGQQKFSVEVAGRKAIPITFSHPSRGTHYYLRRPAPSP